MEDHYKNMIRQSPPAQCRFFINESELNNIKDGNCKRGSPTRPIEQWIPQLERVNSIQNSVYNDDMEKFENNWVTPDGEADEKNPFYCPNSFEDNDFSQNSLSFFNI